jgi:hypothetical protein
VELFTIQCTTCKARLVVKDESVIGEILACPKCNSMVQVVPPLGWKRAGSNDASPGELESQRQATPQPSGRVAAAAASEPPKAKAAAAVPPALPPQPTLSTVAAAPLPPVSVDAEVRPSLWAAATAWAKREWMILAGSLAGGAALGTVAWAVVAWRSAEPVVVADASGSAAAVAEPPDSVAKSPLSASADPLQPNAPAMPPQHEVEPVTAPAPQAKAEERKAVTPAVADGSHPQAEPPASGETETGAPSKPAPALRLEPIPFAGPPLQAAPRAPSAVPSAAEEASAEVPPEAVAEDLGDEESLGKPAPLSRDEIDERLSVSLGQVEFAGVALGQFATFISDLTGVPVALDEAALAKGDLGRKTPISVKLSETTVGDVLRTAVEGAGLTVAIHEGKIVVTRGER